MQGGTVKISKALLLFGLFTVVLTGCASQIMVPASPIETPDNDKALVTFLMLSSMLTNTGSYGQSITPIEYDIWDGEKFIGALSKDTYIQYEAEQGEHLFIARGGNWSFVKANIQTGKNYYLYLNVYPRLFGPWGVYLQPVKEKDKELLSEFPSKLNNLTSMSIIKEKYEGYMKERITEVRNEIEIFKSNSEYGHSILEPRDGL